MKTLNIKIVLVVALILGLSSAFVQARQLQQDTPDALTANITPRKRGHVHIVGALRDPAVSQQLDALLAVASPEPVSTKSWGSSSSVPPKPRTSHGPAAIPTAKTNIKRVYFQNNCTCTSKDVFPVIALSYKPVQAADFYTIGYWELAGCKSRYLLATTWGTIGIWGELNNGVTEWSGDVPLTVYNPAEDQCEKPRDFVEYNLSNNWQDYTVYLNC